MRLLLAATIILFTCNSWADTASVGPNGINSKITSLDGTGIEIGQLEEKRPAKFNYDTDDLVPPFTKRVASNTSPTKVYFGPSGGINSQDPVNSSNIGIHATEVAQIMVGTAGPQEGVAPFANLYSAGFTGEDVDAAATLDRLVSLSGTNLQGKAIRMRAINLSFTRESEPPVETLDGQEYLTQFIDWSASRQDITYSISWGNSDTYPNRVPQDSFNAIKVAASQKPMGEDTFRQFAASNSTEGGPSGGGRSGIDILAPGQDINLLDPGDAPVQVSGTSLASPHVTGAVALLQQYARSQIEPPVSNPRFSSNSQRHEVMKAVLLNSADKKSGAPADLVNVFASLPLPHWSIDWRRCRSNTSSSGS